LQVAPRAQPFIRRVLQHLPGELLEAECTLDLAEDLFLHDHTLGGAIAALEPSRLALPIVPLTVSMEILAEAAAYLRPDLTFVEMRTVRAYRWILLELPTLRLQISARRMEDGPTPVFHVLLKEADEPAASAHLQPILEGEMVMAARRPAPPQVTALTLQDEQPSRWHGQDVYTEGMFHGPIFQVIDDVTRRGRDGTAANMLTPPLDRFLRSWPAPRFVAEPVLMDAAGQLIGLWTLESLDQGFVVFPNQLARLTFYGPPFLPGERAICQARIQLLEGNRVTSDIDLLDESGTLRVRLLGWEDKRFHITRRLYQFILRPGRNALSDDWPAPLGDASLRGDAVCRRIGDWAAWESNFDFWTKVLAYGALTPRERTIWAALTGPPPRRRDWLLGRIAAKEAVAALVLSCYGLDLAPADVEIETDAQGVPQVRGPWLGALDAGVAVSIAHSDGQIVALAARGPARRPRGVGIDIEPAARPTQDFAAVAFTPDEVALLAGLDDASWPLRLWCAKEATGKALGHGLPGPHSVVATAIDPAQGSIRLQAAGALLAAAPALAGAILAARTTLDAGLVVATVFNPD
jgi:phosphopantetheinyl transferase